MLRNKFVLLFVGIALIGALIYNINFFASRRNVQSPNPVTHSGEIALASLPPHAADIVTEKDGNLFSPAIKQVKIVDNLKSFALDSRAWGRNPFLTREEEFSLQAQHSTGEGNKEKEPTIINGILIGSDRRVAIIDHTVVGEGEWLGAEQVVEIGDGEAILALGKKRRSVVMETPSIAITVEKPEDGERKNEH